MIDWESCVCEMTVWRSRNWGDDFSVRRICVHGASLWTVAVADLRYSALWELLTLVPRIDWFVSAGFLLGVSALLLWHRYMAAEERRLPYSIPEHVVMWSKAMRRWTGTPGIYVSEGRNRVNDFSDSGQFVWTFEEDQYPGHKSRSDFVCAFW